MEQPEYTTKVQFGCVEVRSWIETEVDERGEFRFVGMGSRTDYDQDGKITAHKVEPNGLVARMIGGNETPRRATCRVQSPLS
jgi:hypothetical protein